MSAGRQDDAEVAASHQERLLQELPLAEEAFDFGVAHQTFFTCSLDPCLRPLPPRLEGCKLIVITTQQEQDRRLSRSGRAEKHKPIFWISSARDNSNACAKPRSCSKQRQAVDPSPIAQCALQPRFPINRNWAGLNFFCAKKSRAVTLFIFTGMLFHMLVEVLPDGLCPSLRQRSNYFNGLTLFQTQSHS